MMKSSSINWNDKHILVVEDEPMTYKLIQIMLGKTGAILYKAMDGREAVEYCKNSYNKVDLILMDIGLPKMNGYDATKMIRKTNPNIPIIAQTAYVLKEQKDRCFESGCNEYLAKPYSSDELIKIMSKFL